MENRRFAERTGLVWLLIVLLSTMLIAPGWAMAEEAGDDYVLDATVVTATKTGETELQETPISISVFDDDFLKNSKSYNLTDLAMFTPNVEISSVAGVAAGYIRGIGTRNTGVGGEANVAYYIDGVYNERMLGATADFLDVERVEILRGPQGTLYGRNATGGAINVISKRPSNELELEARGEYGSFNRTRLEAMVSGPIVKDKLKVRGFISDIKSDGYVNNLSGEDLYDTDSLSIRGALEWNPTGNIDVILRGDTAESRPHGNPVKNFSSTGYAGALGYTPPSDYWDARINTVQQADIEASNLSGTVIANLSGDTYFRSITGYGTWKGISDTDWDGSQYDLYSAWASTDVEQVSQELQLDGTNGPFKWVAGLYYYNMTDDALYKYDINYALFALNIPILYPVDWIVDATVESTAYAAFGSVTYNLTDKLALTTGLRYSYDEKELDSDLTTIDTVLVTTVTTSTRDDDHWEDLSPKFGVDYQMDADTLVYGVVSKGFKSGTYVPWNPATIGVKVDPETLWNYEVGVKRDWLNKRLRTNVAAFFMDYEDMQLETQVGGQPGVDNAGESEILGLELETYARVMPSLTLNAAVSYLDSEFKDYTTTDRFNVLRDASGNRLPNIPEWKMAFGATQVFDLNQYGFLTLRGDLVWSDEVYFNAFEDSALSQESTTTINALAKYETPEGMWSVELYGKNLTNEETANNVQVTMGSANDIVKSLNPPMTLGFAVSIKY